MRFALPIAVALHVLVATALIFGARRPPVNEPPIIPTEVALRQSPGPPAPESPKLPQRSLSRPTLSPAIDVEAPSTPIPSPPSTNPSTSTSTNPSTSTSTNPSTSTSTNPSTSTSTSPDRLAAIASARRKINAARFYPELAKTRGIEGRVALRFVVDPTGALTAVDIEHGAHALLDEAATAAVRKAAPFSPLIVGENHVTLEYFLDE
jgi:protein TonB